MHPRGLLRRDDGAHADDAGERQLLVRDVEDVVRNEWLARDQRHADHAQIFDVAAGRHLRQPGIHRLAHGVDRPGEDHLVENGRDPVCDDLDAAALTRPHRLHFHTRAHLASALRDAGEKRFEHFSVAAGNVTQLFLLRGAVTRREQTLDVRPDENGGDAPVILAELGQQQRLPHLLERGAARDAHQEALHRLVFQAAPVVDARAIEDSERQAHLVPQVERRKAQKIDSIAERMEAADRRNSPSAWHASGAGPQGRCGR